MNQYIPLWVITALCTLVAVYNTMVVRPHAKGKEEGNIAADIRYIKETVARMEQAQTFDRGRLNELERSQAITHEMAKSAHKRIDNLEGVKKHEN